MGGIDFRNLHDLTGAKRGEIPVRSACFGFSREFVGSDHVLIWSVVVSLPPGGCSQKKKSEGYCDKAGPTGKGEKLADSEAEKGNDPDDGCDDDPLVGPKVEKAVASDSEISLAFADFAHEISGFFVEGVKKKSGVTGRAGAGGVI